MLCCGLICSPRRRSTVSKRALGCIANGAQENGVLYFFLGKDQGPLISHICFPIRQGGNWSATAFLRLERYSRGKERAACDHQVHVCHTGDLGDVDQTDGYWRHG